MPQGRFQSNQRHDSHWQAKQFLGSQVPKSLLQNEPEIFAKNHWGFLNPTSEITIICCSQTSLPDFLMPSRKLRSSPRISGLQAAVGRREEGHPGTYIRFATCLKSSPVGCPQYTSTKPAWKSRGVSSPAAASTATILGICSLWAVAVEGTGRACSE